MYNYYDIDVIPIILNQFKVNDIIICGISDKVLLSKIFEYCDEKDAYYTAIDSNDFLEDNFINGHILEELPKLNNYDAIFINDDPNWYSVYNELNIIKKNNNFPLVFICNNIFPHKKRDSYMNPNLIPEEFRKEYSRELILEGIHIYDSFYHATEENTPKNGVQTAIEDFLSENSSIGLMDIRFLNGITILYPLNTISHLRMGKLTEELDGLSVNLEDVSDNIMENKLLINYFSNLPLSGEDLKLIDTFRNELDEKEQIIKDFEHKIEISNAELSYKNSKINGFDSKLDLKDSQIKNMESKLLNRDTKIDSLNKELKVANNQIEDTNNKLSSLRDYNTRQLSKLEGKEYCISCYKEEICNNHLEIEYLKKETFLRKLLSPFAYLFLIFKSNPKELFLNFKLYKALKSSKCFDIGYYLNNNEDIRESNWCNYFSPELHYVCNGFNEDRKFNKKYFNRNSKEELLEYIINCP